MKRIALYLVAAAAFVAVGFAVAKLVDQHGSGGERPVNDQEFAEMNAAAVQAAAGDAAGRIHLVEIKVARTDEGTWASAEEPTPAARLLVIFTRKAGTWTEIAASSGCLRESELPLPVRVRRILRACVVAG